MCLKTMRDQLHVEGPGAGNQASYAYSMTTLMGFMKNCVVLFGWTLPYLRFLIKIIPEFHSLPHFRKMIDSECRTDVQTWKN